MSYSTATNVSYWAYLDDDAFESDHPVSTGDAWFLRNNLSHLADSCGQFRINWAAGPSRNDSPSWTDSISATFYWSQAFPLTIFSPGSVPGLDVRIGAAIVGGGGDSVAISARIVPAVGEVWDAGNSVLWEGSGSTTSTTGVWVIDEADEDGYITQEWKRGLVPTPTKYGATAQLSAVCMARLELKLVTTSSVTHNVYLCGVQVREFPVWW